MASKRDLVMKQTGAEQASPLATLPTLQRNALRKIFDRPHFTPEEVAGLGLRRLQQAEGIGCKGMEVIRVWLNGFGFDLARPGSADESGAQKHGKSRNRLESAMRMLKTNGYVVYRRRPSDSQEEIQT